MRIGTPDDLGKIISQLFRLNWLLALILMAAGLAFDWFFGHQMFQRFGALLVGLGVLHYFSAREIESQINKYEMLQKAFKSRISRFLPYPVDTNDLKYVGALNVIASVLEPQIGHKDISAAKIVLDEVLDGERDLPKLKLKLRDVRNFEVYTVILGTIVWAFGDLLTNFFFHCSFNWSCNGCP